METFFSLLMFFDQSSTYAIILLFLLDLIAAMLHVNIKKNLQIGFQYLTVCYEKYTIAYKDL